MIFDTTVLVVLLLSALHAFWRGFIREVLTIFGAIGGGLAAVAYGDEMRPFTDSLLGITAEGTTEKLLGVVPMTLVSGALAYGAVFILVFGILSVLSHLIAEQVRAVGLGAIDRSLGVVFGLIRGLLILAIFYLPAHLVMTDEKKEEWFKNARTHFVIEGVAQMIQNTIPDHMIQFQNEKKEQNTLNGSTRDTLEKMDVLQPQNGDPIPSSLPSSSNKENQQDGYSSSDRKMLDTLIDAGAEAAKESAKNMSPDDINAIIQKLPPLE